MKRTYWKIIWTFVMAWAMAGGFVFYRHFRMRALSEIALSQTTDTASADAAIRELNGYAGPGATDLLVQIATAVQGFIDNRQVLAIECIAQRNDSRALTRLTRLLQPHIDLARREAVAKALERGVCTEQCVQFVLHYEERLWCGGVAREEMFGITDQIVRSALDKEHAQMLEGLDRTLHRNEHATLKVLREIYGLGSPEPSSFALRTLERVPLRSACPLLVSSQSILQIPSQKDTIDRLLRNLNCTTK